MSDEELVGTAYIRLEVDKSGVTPATEQAIKEAEAKGVTKSRESGTKQGDAQGDAFGQALRKKLQATLDQLPTQRDIKLDADTSPAERKLFEIRTELDELSHKNIGIDVEDSVAAAKIAELSAQLKLLTKDKDVRVRVDSQAAFAVLGALDKQINGVASDAGKIGEKGKDGMGPLLSAAIALGPAIVPLAGGLLAASTAAVGLGLAGVIAIKGIENEIKTGGKSGQQYVTLIGSLKSEWLDLQKTTAQGVLPGFTAAVGKLRVDMPELNIQLKQSAVNLGDTVQHLVGGLVGGFNTFSPLIHDAETGADHLAASFEKWATGPGGEKFVTTLETEFHQLGPAIGSILSLTGKFIESLAPVGSTVLGEIELFSKTVNELPVSVLQAATTAFVIWKTVTLITAPFEKAAVALKGYATAEKEAAAGSIALGESAGAGGLGKFAGGLSKGLALITPWAAGLVAADLALGTITKSTDAWSTSQNTLEAVTGQTLHALDNLFHFKNPLDGYAASADNLRNSVKAAQEQIDELSLSSFQAAYGATKQVTDPDTGKKTTVTGDAEVQFQKDQATYKQYRTLAAQASADADKAEARAQAAGFNNAKLNAASDVASAKADALTEKWVKLRATLNQSAGDPALQAAKDFAHYTDIETLAATNYATAIEVANTKQLNYTKTQLDSSGQISQASSAYDTLETSVQKSVDAETAFLAVKKNQTITIDGTKYSLDAYNKVLSQTSTQYTDQFAAVAAAKGILEGHTQALAADKSQLALLQTQQDNVNTAYGKAAAQTGLTTQQLDLYSSALGINTSDLADGIITSDQFAKVMGAVKNEFLNANTALSGWLSAIDTYNKSGKTAADTAVLLGAAIKASIGPQLDAAGANLSAATATESAASTIDQYSASIDKNGNLLGQLVKVGKEWVIQQPKLTAGSAAIASALSQQATAAISAAENVYQNEASIKGGAKAADDAYGVYLGYRQELINQANQAGITGDAAQNLADKYLGIKNSGDLKKQIELLGGKETNAILVGILKDLDAFTGHHYAASLGLDDSEFTTKVEIDKNKITNLGSTKASVSIVTNRGSATGSTQAHGSVLDFYRDGAILFNRAVEKFASGGESHVAQIAPAGSMRLWAEPETGGEAYIPLAPSKRARSMAILGDVANRFGVQSYAEGGINGGSGSYQTSEFAAAARDLIATLEQMLQRPWQLVSNGTVLARVVNEQNNKLNRLN